MPSKTLAVLMAFFLLLIVYAPTAAAQEVCNSREDVIRLVQNAALSRPDSIRFRFSSTLYRHIADAAWMGEILPYADILTAKWQYTSTECTLKDITYAQMEQCETREDVKWALQRVQRRPLYLHLTPSLYESLTRNRFAGLYELHGEIGLQSDFSYYKEPMCVLVYQQVEYAQSFGQAENLEQLKQVFWQKTEALESSFSLHLPWALYDRLITEKTNLLNDLTNNCGILDCKIYYSSDTGIVEFDDIQYYPGKRVVAAARTEKWQLLTREEQELYNKAAEIIGRCYTPGVDAYTFLLRCHDEIIRRTAYASGRYMSDTAVGALVYGYADCDGYADALYLLCNLAGVECHYQHGEGIVDPANSGPHMWNLVKLDGQWYFTDVTWDDGEQVAFYGYMNLGADRAKKGYVWNEEGMLQPVSPTTSDALYYYKREGKVCRSVAQAAECLNASANVSEPILLMLSHDGRKSDTALLDQLMENVTVAGRCMTKSLGNDLFVCYLPK